MNMAHRRPSSTRTLLFQLAAAGAWLLLAGGCADKKPEPPPDPAQKAAAQKAAREELMKGPTNPTTADQMIDKGTGRAAVRNYIETREQIDKIQKEQDRRFENLDRNRQQTRPEKDILPEDK